jgi:hypothetical protein
MTTRPALVHLDDCHLIASLQMIEVLALTLQPTTLLRASHLGLLSLRLQYRMRFHDRDWFER